MLISAIKVDLVTLWMIYDCFKLHPAITRHSESEIIVSNLIHALLVPPQHLVVLSSIRTRVECECVYSTIVDYTRLDYLLSLPLSNAISATPVTNTLFYQSVIRNSHRVHNSRNHHYKY